MCVNSDYPNLLEIDLVHEYQMCRKHYRFTEIDFEAMNEMALRHSFLPREAKEGALRRYFAT